MPGRSTITVASWFGMPEEHADATTVVLWEAGVRIAWLSQKNGGAREGTAEVWEETSKKAVRPRRGLQPGRWRSQVQHKITKRS